LGKVVTARSFDSTGRPSSATIEKQDAGMRLSTQLTAAMVALVLLTATAVGYLAYRNVEALALPRDLDRIDARAQALATELEAGLRAVRADVIGFGAAVAVEGIIRSQVAGGVDPIDGTSEAVWRARMAARYAAELAAKPSYRTFRIVGLDGGGREIVRVDRSGPDGAVRIVPDAELRRVADQTTLQEATKLRAGEVYVSPIDLNRQNGIIETPAVPILRVATPLHKPDGTPFGMVVSNIDLRPAFARIRAAAPDGGRVYVVDDQGHYLVHPDASRELGFAAGSPARLQDDFPELAPMLAQQADKQGDNTGARLVRDRAGADFGIGWHAVRLADGPRVAVIEAVPYAELMAAAIAVRNSGLLVGLAAVLIALALAVRFAQSLTKPLVQITQAVEGFARGQSSAIPTGAGGEIGRLAQAFARMAADVRDKTAALEREIAEHRRTEQALAKQQERERLFSAVVESTDDAIVTKTLDGAITGWNRGAERLFGFTAAEAIGRPIGIIVPDDRAAEIADLLQRIGNGESVQHYETVRISKDRRRIDVALSVSPVRSAAGAVIGASKIARDVTEANKVRAALRDSERMSRGIIDTALDAFVQMDESGAIVDWNPQAQAVFGWSREEAIGKPLGELIVPEQHRSRHRDGLVRFLLGGESTILGKRIAIEALRRDGSELKVELSVTALQRHAGTVFNAFIRDMTEAIAAEERTRQSQKMEAVGQLVGGIAHDFNNILTVITGTIDILADGVAEDARLAPIATLISEAADRGAELTAHLLAFARKQPLQPRETDINELLVGAQFLFRPSLGEQIEIEASLEEGAWTALVDPTQLTTALLNLAVNARDAMPGGGKLTLETKNVVLDESYAAANRDVQPGSYVMIAVSDTGDGIPEALIDKVFEPFFSTKAVGKGTGLGLSMVYGFVKQSSGHIKVYSEEGHGTTIKIYLPRSGAEPEQAAEQALDPAVEGGSEAILIVEDDPLVRTYVTARLQNLGYQTLEAGNAAEAIAIVDGGAQFDLLFTDVIMSGSMNGRQLADEMAKRRPGVKVLFTSGYTENAIVHHGRLDPGVLLLAKPYRNAELARMIRCALTAGEAAPDGRVKSRGQSET
jgi:PAS domain S-box-containing protein